MPTNDGAPSQILQTDGNGTVNWVDDNHPENNTSVIDTTNTASNTTTSNTTEPSGLEAIDEGNGIGWRLIGKDPANYANIGENAVDLSSNSIHFHSKTGATLYMSQAAQPAFLYYRQARSAPGS